MSDESRQPPNQARSHRNGDPGREESDTEEEETRLPGTLFIMLVFLMLIFGTWAMMFKTLLER